MSFLLLFMLLWPWSLPAPQVLLPPSSGDCAVQSLTPLGPGGEDTYSPVNGWLLYTNPDSSGNFQLYTVRPDGSGLKELTAQAVPGGPSQNRHKNAPDWSPDGRSFAVQVEWELDGTRWLPGGAMLVANGTHTNVWVASADGQHWSRLTNYAVQSADPLQNGAGALGPKFSPDGKHLMWSKLVKGADSTHAFGTWRLMQADLTTDANGLPAIAALHDISPAGGSWFESHGFSPDSRLALFTADIDLSNQTGQDEWTLDLTSGQLTNLTSSPNVWDEHARFAPNGLHLNWMSSLPFAWKLGDTLGLKTEALLMDPSGGNVQQLTHFNTPGYPEYTGTKTVVGGSAWVGGSRIVLTVVANYPQRTRWLLTFAGPCGG